MKTTYFTKSLILTLCLGSSFFFSSCEKEPDPINDPATPINTGAKGPYERGVFVTNEGDFSGSGSVSYYDQTTRNLRKSLFQTVNNRPLGSIVQSIAVHNDKAYIVINNGAKIEVTDANTFQSAGTISGLSYPRYFVASGNKGYVTEYVTFTGAGRVSIIDLTTNTVTKTIPVGKLPEQLLIVENKLYVTNSDENFISVINLTTETAESPITIANYSNSLVRDANNKIWVLCGETYGTTDGTLVRINPVTNTVETMLTFPALSSSPQDLTINAAKNVLYYTFDGKVYRMNISDAALPTTSLINRNFYGIGVDPQDNIIYGADAGDFVSDGKVIRYNTNGAVIDSFGVNIAPNGFLFK